MQGSLAFIKGGLSIQARCKDKQFFLYDCTAGRLFHFSSKTGGNRPSAYGNWLRFSALGPELSSRRVAFWVVFHQNSTVTESRMPCLSAFSGCGARRSAPPQSLQPPPPYAPEAIATPPRAVYVRIFACVAMELVYWATDVRRATSAVVAGNRTRKAPACSRSGHALCLRT